MATRREEGRNISIAGRNAKEKCLLGMGIEHARGSKGSLTCCVISRYRPQRLVWRSKLLMPSSRLECQLDNHGLGGK